MPHPPFVLLVGIGCLFLGLLTPSPAEAEDWTLEGYVGQRSPWDGFPVGTTIHTRRTTEIPQEDEKAPIQVINEVKKTLVERREDRVVLETSRLVGGRWRKTREEIPLRDLSKVVVEDLGEDTIQVEETDYICKKSRVKRPGPRGPESALIWSHPEAGILKIQMETPSTSILQVTQLAKDIEAGGRTFKGRVFSVEAGSKEQVRVRGTTTLGLEVPGAMLRERIRVEGGPAARKIATDLLGLEIPEAAPESPASPENAEGAEAPEAPPEKTPPQDGKEDAPDR